MIWYIVAVGCGGFIGAIVRFEISKHLNKSGLPAGTLLVNSIGSFFIGRVMSADLSLEWTAFWAVGLAGALTTYSTLMKEIWTYWTEGRKVRAVIYTILTFGIGIGLAFIGYSV